MDLYLDTSRIKLKPKFKMLLKHEEPINRIDPNFIAEKIVIIQKSVRRYFARQRFRLLLERSRRIQGIELVLSWQVLIKHKQFRIAVYFLSKEARFCIKANSPDYFKPIESVSIPVKTLSIDAGYLNKTIIRGISRKIKENTEIKSEKGVYKLEVNVFKVVQQTQNMDSEYNEEFGGLPPALQKRKELMQARETLRNNIYTSKPLNIIYDQEPFLIEHPTASNHEDLAKEFDIYEKKVRFIQNHFRSFIARRNLKTLMKLKEDPEFIDSQSLGLLHFIVGKDEGPKGKIRVSETPKNRHSERPSFGGQKGGNGMQPIWAGTKKFSHSRVATIEVYLLAPEGKNKAMVLCEFLFDITRKTQSLKIPVDDIHSDFDPKKFLKKIKKSLLNRLEFDRMSQKVIFNKNANSKDDSDDEKAKNRRGSNLNVDVPFLGIISGAAGRNIQTDSSQVKKGDDKKERSSVEKALITIQAFIRAKQARKQFELLKLSSARNTKHLARLFEKVNGRFLQLNFYLIPAKGIISVHAALVEDSTIQAKVFIPMKGILDNPEPLLEKAKTAQSQQLKLMFASTVASLKLILEIEATQKWIKLKPRKDYEKKLHILHDLQSAEDFIMEELKHLKEKIDDQHPQSERLSTWKKEEKEDSKQSQPHEKNQNLFEVETNDIGTQSVAPLDNKAKETHTEKKLESFNKYEKAAIKIQSRLRAHLAREEYDLVKESKKSEEKSSKKEKVKKYIVRKRIRKIDGVYWEFTAFKAKKTPDVLYFIAREMDGGAHAKKYEESFKIDKGALINTNGRKLEDYLIDCIRFQENRLIFDLQHENENYGN